ncbi:MAG TPA: PAS domain S-box protein [Terriglobia bacterium]|nr:PAS domain S-box protein [Terriglobia bacterium]
MDRVLPAILLLCIGALLFRLYKLRQFNRTLLEAGQLSALTGDAFFRSIAEHLCRALKTDYAVIGQLSRSGQNIETLVVVEDGKVIDNMVYAIAGTPCERTLAALRCLIPDNVQSVFPLDRITPMLGLRSYLGVALTDSAGAPLGVMSVMSRRPIKNVQVIEATLNVFARRASSEMERHRAKSAFEESESRNQAILRAMPDLMFVHDQNGVFLDYYARDESQLLVPPQVFLGKTVEEIMPPEVAAEIVRTSKQARETNEPASFEYSLELHGAARYFEARTVRLGPDKVLTIVRDETNRKTAELALQESRHFTERIAETIPSVLFVYDLEQQRNVYVNRRSEAALGYSDEEVMQMGERFLAMTMHPDDLIRLPELAREYLQRRDGEVFEHYFRLRHRNGEWRWIHRYATIFARTADGRPKQIVGTATDITALKNAEEELRSLSSRLLNIQDEERRRIARELHDGTAQNLFAVTLSIASLMKRDGLPQFARDALIECSRVCDESLRELRTLSYLLHPPMFDHTGLADTLKWFTEGFSRRSGIQVELVIADGMERLLPAVERDLFRVVQEGLVNVSRHSGSAKAVVRMEQRADEVVLEIRDFGKGLSRYPFDSPFGSHTGGVGITGMRERLRHVGGRLEIQSSSTGTTLIASVPVRLDKTETSSPERKLGATSHGH